MYTIPQIKQQVDKGNIDPTSVPDILAEQEVATELVRAILAQDPGFTITVDDGGDEPAVERSRDEAAILDALCNTDEDQIFVRDSAGKLAGWFQLVYGNSAYELIADHTANGLCDLLNHEVYQVRLGGRYGS